jgi:hypothetical protein
MRHVAKEGGKVKRFIQGQRVMVKSVDVGVREFALSKPALGTVVRLRRNDDGAWVSLYERNPNDSVHPFPVGDSRATHVLTYPEHCEAAP